METLPAPLAWTVLIGVFVAIAALLVWRKAVGKRVPGYKAHCEYWIYALHEQLPAQEQIMERMISDNPHNRPGRPCIGAREGMLFTDIRLHIALAKRAKNPHVFRPDLFEEDLVPSRQILERLSDAKSLIKVRYISEAILKDMRHLQFMPHLADTMTDLTEGMVVYDVVCEQIYSSEDFKDLLATNNNAERPDVHVRVLWDKDIETSTGHAYTKGLKKLGLAELRTDPVEPDQQVLVAGLLLRMAHALVRDPSTEGPFEYEEYGDTFVLEPRFAQGANTHVAIKRRRGT